MNNLDAMISGILRLLGGPTPGNANLLDTAMLNRLRQLESQMIRSNSQEAAALQLENTRHPQYPVPADHLPTPGPIAFPPSPIGFSYLAFVTLFSPVDKYLSQEYRRFDNVQSYAVLESRTLRLIRTFRAQFRTTLEGLLRAPQPTQTAGSMPGLVPLAAAVRVQDTSMDVCPPEITALIEVWDCYNRNRDVEVLELFAPLLNSYTARVPPFILRCLVLHMGRLALWTEDLTRDTLEMLASPLIPSLTFHHATTWIVNAFCSQDGITALRYTYDGISATATLELSDDRCVTMTDIAADDEFMLFSSDALSRVRTLSISNNLRPSTAAHVWDASAETLTSITIEFDGRPVAPSHVSLLVYRGRGRLSCPNVTTIRLAASPTCDGFVDVSLADVRAFVTSALPGVPNVVVDHDQIRLLT